MKSIRRPAPGERLQAQTVIDLIDNQERLSHVHVGPGMTMRLSSTGMAYGLTRLPEQAPTRPDVKGTPKVLNCVQGTQDTDTYDRSTDKVPVQIQVVTDIQYDATSHKLQMSYRTLTCVGVTAISAESAWVDITTAVEDNP